MTQPMHLVNVDDPERLAAWQVQPYPASWIDHVTAWIEQLPAPGWWICLGFWLGLYLVQTLIKWQDGTYPVGTVYPFHAIWTGSTIFCLALITYLDRAALAALEACQPALTTSAVPYARLQYQLTTLPACTTVLASLAGVVYVLAVTYIWSGPELAAVLKLYTSPVATIIDTLHMCLLWSVVGAFVYHTIHQLRLVSAIAITHTQIDLFQLGPLYAFSSLTARTAGALLLVLTAWLATIPTILDSPSGPATYLVFVGLAVLTFVWPLFGSHQRLEQEKQRLQAEATQRTKAILPELHQHVDAGTYAELSAITTALDGLGKEQALLEKIPTWPWRPETVRGVATTVLVPVGLWIVTRVLERFVP